MDIITEAGDAADALRINQLYQSFTRSAYWVSGGAVTPGTSTTQIAVNVEAGEAVFAGSAVSWTATSVALADANVDPRVDVIFVRSDGTLDDITGTPHPYRPNADENGDPITPAPFEHWEPAPDDGTSFDGLPLACVLVEPTDVDSTDITTEKIQDRRLEGTALSEFVRGDAIDNGRVQINTAGTHFILSDPADATSHYFHRNSTQGKLFIGSPTAIPQLRTELLAGSNDITGVASLASNTGGPLPIDGGVNALGDLRRRGQSAVSSGDGAAEREIYVQSTTPTTNNPYIRFEPQ